jgi:hypothetical protein
MGRIKVKGYNMVYIWQSAENFPSRLIAEYDRKKSPDRFLFKKGIFFEKIDPPIFNLKAKISKIRRFDHISNQSLIPLISCKMAKCLLDNFSDDIQLIDTLINCEDGVIDDYKLVNSIHKVKAINHDVSECKYDEDGWLWAFDYLEYYSDCLGAYNVARDEEYLGNLIVSEKVKNIFESNKFIGYGLYTPNDTI